MPQCLDGMLESGVAIEKIHLGLFTRINEDIESPLCHDTRSVYDVKV